MLDNAKIAEIMRLLADGWRSQRKIAALTGVSRGTVQAVASGRRKLRPPREDLSVGGVDTTQKIHCTTCGGFIHPPCQLCKARRFITEHGRSISPEPPEGTEITHDLKDDHHGRYEEIRRKKEAAGEDQTAEAWQEPSAE